MNRTIVIPVLAIAVLGSLLLAACGGAEADVETLATRAAGIEPSTELSITARALRFDKDTLVAPAGREVTLHFDNQDGGAIHNVAIYTDKGVKEKLFGGDLFTGRDSRDYRFTIAQAGTFDFRCDAHPDMHGAFVVR